MYKVLKKNGSVEDYSWKKLVGSIENTGATKEETEKVAQDVELWLSTVAEDGMIKSYDLHVKIMETLKALNPEAAKRFEEFKKPEPQ